eukprot:g6944.t1
MAGNGHWQDETSMDQDGLLPVVKFLQSALAMKAKGDGHHYQHLVAQLLTRDDPETLWRLYLGLSQCVTIISQHPEEYKELIDAVFRFDWRASDKIVRSFASLLSHLVSANSTCMVPAMHMLVRNLVLTLRDLDGEGNVDPLALTRQHHVHAALQASLTLVPSGRSKLFGVLKQNYPHRRLRAEILSDYALHALRVVQYAPLIEESVLRLIIEKSLEIDVEIKIMDTGEAVVDEDDECEALFTMDDVLDGTADIKKQNTEEVDEMAEKLDGVMLVVFTYLDQRLTAHASLPPEKILETPLTPSINGAAPAEDGAEGGEAGVDSNGSSSSRAGRSSTGGSQGMEPVARLLKSLLLVFEESILPTHRSKFVQFVLFFASGRAHGLGYALTSKLIDVLRDDMKPKLTRQSSVAYLASFLARGSFVDSSLVSSAVQALLDWAARYLDEHVDGLTVTASTPQTSIMSTPGSKSAFETPMARRSRARPQSWHGTNPPPGSANAGGPRGGAAGVMPAPLSAVSARSVAGGGGSAHGSTSKGRAGADHMLFFSVCQATFYVMCFRGDELAAMEGFGGQAAIWQRLLTCPLFPLRRCLDTVRREFARLCCGLMEDYLKPELVEHLAGISEERPQVSQTITVGSSFSCSTPRSTSSVSMSMSMSGSTWTPSRVTKAGGLGRGSNPLDSFFPFDPYLLRRSHAYVAGMYNSWKAQDDGGSRRRRHRRRKKAPANGASADAEDSSSSGNTGSSSLTSDSDDDDDSDSDGDGDASDAMDASSLSFRDGASGGILARSRRRRAEQKAESKKRKETRRRLANRGNRGGRRGGGGGEGEGSGDFSSSSSEDDESRRMSRRMADTHITESMSVTPGSSVACGSLMGRSLGNAMSSSFADDGLVWGAAAAAAAGSVVGTPDDAFFHENVSPSVSPPLASSAIGVADRSQPLDIGVGGRSKRALF